MFRDTARQLHEYLQQYGVSGVKIFDDNDPSTWSIVDYFPDTTDEQKRAAQAALKTFVYVEPPPQLSGEEILELLVKEGVISKQKVDAARNAKRVR